MTPRIPTPDIESIRQALAPDASQANPLCEAPCSVNGRLHLACGGRDERPQEGETMTLGPATQPMPNRPPAVPFPQALADEIVAALDEMRRRIGPQHTCTMACGISCLLIEPNDDHVRTGSYNEGAAL